VVIVGVRAQDGGQPPRPDRSHDRIRVVRGVDDHALGLVAQQPDVVVHLPGAAVQGEGARGDEVIQRDHEK
jgi:hypothetical protein